MKLVIIAAVASNGVIGHKGEIPWKIKKDFQNFKRLTEGYPCIMGRRTFGSLPDEVRPLPNRENIVVSGNPWFQHSSITKKNSLEEAIEYCKGLDSNRAFVIGGGQVYKQTIDIVDNMVISHIHKDYDGDVFFPEIDHSKWEVLSKRLIKTADFTSRSPVEFTLVHYRRKGV